MPESIDLKLEKDPIQTQIDDLVAALDQYLFRRPGVSTQLDTGKIVVL